MMQLMGVFVGYELPIMLRVSHILFDSNWDFDGERNEFTTIALGVGFTGCLLLA